MIRYKKINIDIYQRLFEGKKQAMGRLLKFMDKSQATILIKELEKLDPTSPKNKYLEMLTRVYLEWIDTRIDIDEKSIREDLAKFKRIYKDDDIHKKLQSIEKRNLKLDINKIFHMGLLITEVDKLFSIKTKSIAKAGMKELQKGKDYINIPLENKDVSAFIPLDYKINKIIASNKVGNFTAEWCTAENRPNHWNQYIHESGGILVYIVNYNPQKATDINNKQAMYFYRDTGKVEKFDSEDNTISKVLGQGQIKKYVKANWSKIRNKLNKEIEGESLEQKVTIQGYLREIYKALSSKGIVEDAEGYFSDEGTLNVSHNGQYTINSKHGLWMAKSFTTYIYRTSSSNYYFKLVLDGEGEYIEDMITNNSEVKQAIDDFVERII